MEMDEKYKPSEENEFYRKHREFLAKVRSDNIDKEFELIKAQAQIKEKENIKSRRQLIAIAAMQGLLAHAGNQSWVAGTAVYQADQLIEELDK